MSQSEFDIIRTYFTESGLFFPREEIQLGIGDDAAVIRPPAGSAMVMSTDVLVADVHFPADADPAAIANRALAVNLSDLAAMAAEPLCFTLALTMPSADHSWLLAFSEGLKPLASQYNCSLVGGDLSHGPLSIAIQVQGIVREQPLLRSSAMPGDRIYVSACLGDGAIALLSLDQESHLGGDFCFQDKLAAEKYRSYFSEAFYRPRPRLELAMAVRSHVHACIDISDGLVGDLGHILAASAVGARLQLAQLPVSAAAGHCMNEENCRLAALFGGDDYELCFTAAPQQHDPIQQIARQLGIPVTEIGEITSGEGLQLLDANGKAVHFEQHSFLQF